MHHLSVEVAPILIPLPMRCAVPSEDPDVILVRAQRFGNRFIGPDCSRNGSPGFGTLHTRSAPETIEWIRISIQRTNRRMSGRCWPVR